MGLDGIYDRAATLIVKVDIVKEGRQNGEPNNNNRHMWVRDLVAKRTEEEEDGTDDNVEEEEGVQAKKGFKSED